MVDSQDNCNPSGRPVNYWCATCLDLSQRVVPRLVELPIKKGQGRVVRIHYPHPSSACENCRFLSGIAWSNEPAMKKKHFWFLVAMRLATTDDSDDLESKLFATFAAVNSVDLGRSLRWIVAHPFALTKYSLLSAPEIKSAIAVDESMLKLGREQYTHLRSVFRSCDEQHVFCRRASEDAVLTMNLIDCIDLKLIAGDSQMHYVALSYVWGKQRADVSLTNETDWRNVPRTIRDAIEVTKNLGHRYLWVDRYCVNQSDDRQKHETIASMNTIFLQAKLTIIAAAGSDPCHGLGGVSTALRLVERPAATMGEHTLVRTPIHPRDLVEDSVWETRGWTYQEKILSRRKLVFTGQHICLSCLDYQEFGWYEASLGRFIWTGTSTSYRTKDVHSDRYDILQLPPSPGLIFDSDEIVFHHKSSLCIDTLRFRYYHHLFKFNARMLTFEEDYLDALRGVLSEFARLDRHISNLSLLGSAVLDFRGLDHVAVSMLVQQRRIYDTQRKLSLMVVVRVEVGFNINEGSIPQLVLF